MGLKRITFLILLLLQGMSCWSQQDSIPEIQYSKSTEYKEVFLNRITARLFFVNTSNSLELNDRNSDLFFRLKPNNQKQIGASVAFRAIAISYSFTPNFLKENENSKFFNLNLRNYFGKHWMQAFSIYSEKGFNARNDDFNIYFPGFKSFKIGGATSYIINENFSFRAIVDQNEKQLKSAGSFIPRLVYFYSKFSLNTEDVTNNNLYTFDMAFAPSYYYNFVPTKNMLLSVGGSAGIGINFSNSQEESLTSLLTELNFRGSLTYDIENLYLGAHYNYLVLNHNSDRTTYVKDDIPYFEIFVGYRFKAPKKLVRKADVIDEKLKLK
jgi:hypothetical protein